MKLSRDIINKTEEFTKDSLVNADSGHDFWHITRVLNNAKLINKIEKGDWLVIYLSIMLHDVGDRKVINKETDDYNIARNFLNSLGLEIGVIHRVMFIIENMSFSKNLNNKLKTNNKELMIVQDADRLDAMGAIGIARAFVFGGSRNRPMYDPTKKIQKLTSIKEYQKLNSSTLHHFYEKLFLLKDLINTRTAKKIATKRHGFMKKFAIQFLLEWDGKI